MPNPVTRAFSKLAQAATVATGSPIAFFLAVSVIVVWAVLGPTFDYSDTWQLVINTGTTIVTFLMVFVIQHAQNKEMRAVQMKLNELIAALEGASNRLIDVEGNTEQEMDHLSGRYVLLAASSAKLAIGAQVSVEDDDESNGAAHASEKT